MTLWLIVAVASSAIIDLARAAVNPGDPVGACCLELGRCRVYDSATCSDRSGTYQGDGTDCTPNPCPNQMGACCVGGCSCEVISEDECNERGGGYLGTGVECDPLPCNDPVGACCHEDGSCYISEAYFCYGAVWLKCEPCDPNPCPPLGACCLWPWGDCLITTQESCSVREGEWQGEGGACDPNPCPPIGVCCIDGECLEIVEAYCLVVLGGDWRGEGTTCFPDDPCRPTPTKDQSWGQIKKTYR